MYTILGAGLAGISCSYHLGHGNCILFDKNNYPGGHIYSEKLNGFTWDEGPHVSFTKHEYVKKLFEGGTNNDFLEYPVYPTNYYKGNWIPHPAQSNLYAVPEPLRSECLEDFLASRTSDFNNKIPTNYAEWLEIAFGKSFSSAFPTSYTRKYWTLDPSDLTTEWVGSRVFSPDIETVKKGFEKPLEISTHYITSVRYPRTGGYMQYAKSLLNGANVVLNKKVSSIDLKSKTITFNDNTIHCYEKLISTLPLTDFISYCDAPENIKDAGQNLSCSQLLLINVEVDHIAQVKEHWLYVYDEDKYSTRINFTDLLSPNNAPKGKCGIQVEVYFSKYKPKTESNDYYAQKVISELIEMKLIKNSTYIDAVHTRWVPYANVIFDKNYKIALNKILTWLASFGLTREDDDIMPMTNWDTKQTESLKFGNIILAGRFAQWKYYWTDDCILRGRILKHFDA